MSTISELGEVREIIDAMGRISAPEILDGMSAENFDWWVGS